MERLINHIEYLLRSHNCVIVPAFGAFIINRINARYNKDENIFYPPTSEVCFNPSINNHDGLVANSYARKYGLKFDDAKSLLQQDTASLLNYLKEGYQIELKSYGVLSFEDTICFKPNKNSHKSFGTIGYSPISLNRVQEPQPDLEIEITKENSLGRSFDTHKNYYIAINKTFAKIAASFIFVILLAASVIIPPYLSEGIKNPYEMASVLPQKNNTKTVKNIQTAQPITDAEEIISDREENTPSEEVIASDGRYHLIVATFNSRNKAEKFISLSSNGDALSIKEKNNVFRISAFNSDNKEELMEILKSDDFKKLYSDAWIWDER